MKQYLDTVREVLEKGTRKENRTGVDTLSTFNINYEIDLREGFPLLTTKEISWKNIVVENLWFLSGDTHIGLLQKHKCKFWDPWADESGKVPSAYGNFWRHFPDSRPGAAQPRFSDQLAWVLAELKRNPMSRRLVVSAWAPGNAQTSKLPPCHCLFMFNVQLDRGRRAAALPAPDAAQLRHRARHSLQHRRLRVLARAFLALHRHSRGHLRAHAGRRAHLHQEARRLDGRVRSRPGPRSSSSTRTPRALAAPHHRSQHPRARRHQAAARGEHRRGHAPLRADRVRSAPRHRFKVAV